MRSDIIASLEANRSAFGIELSEEQLKRLANYYDLVIEHNPLVHLVAPCSPEEFATRHVLESLTLLAHLPKGAKFADVGTGAGLPAVPCLLARDDLRAVLIESKEKKASFLRIAVNELGLTGRATVVNRQFEEANISDCPFVTCRALDKFSEKLPRLVKWAGPRRLLLFGGRNLAGAMQKQGLAFVQELMPLSEQRFLFLIAR